MSERKQKGVFLVLYISLMVTLFMMSSCKSSCNHCSSINDSVEDLKYYIDEDLFNGNINEELYGLYEEKLKEIETYTK